MLVLPTLWMNLLRSDPGFALILFSCDVSAALPGYFDLFVLLITLPETDNSWGRFFRRDNWRACDWLVLAPVVRPVTIFPPIILVVAWELLSAIVIGYLPLYSVWPREVDFGISCAYEFKTDDDYPILLPSFIPYFIRSFYPVNIIDSFCISYYCAASYFFSIWAWF